MKQRLLKTLLLAITTIMGSGQMLADNVSVSTATDFGTYNGSYQEYRLTAGNTYILQNDVTIDHPLATTSAGSETITIDLNGHTLSRGLTEATATYYGHAIEVAQGTTLILKDSGTGGKVTGCYSKSNASAIYVDRGTFTLEGGSITENTITTDGGAITNYGGTVTISGGSITNNKVLPSNYANGGGVYNKSYSSTAFSFTMTGGTISGNTNNERGAGLYCNSEVEGSTVNISGGTISDNTAVNSNYEDNINFGQGGGIFCYGSNSKTNPLTVTISGGTISGNKSHNGGGIYLNSKVTLNISGDTKIIDNEATVNWGGGIAASASSASDGQVVNISGGTISDNKAKTYGGGIFLNVATLNLTGGTITGNTAGTSGGGIYMSTSSGTLKVSGSPTVTGNTLADNTTKNNLFFSDSSCKISFGGTFSGTIGVIKEYAGVITSGMGSNATVSNFPADDSNFETQLDGGEAKLVKTRLTTWYELYSALEAGNSVINLGADVTATSTNYSLSVKSGSTVTLNMNGYTIDRANYSGNGVISVPSGSTLTINGGGGTITGGNYTGYSEYAGGITNKGTLTLNNVTISNNKGASYGGGIYNSGTLTLNDGVNITGNTTTYNGGGVYFSGSSMNISGNIQITDNTKSGNANNLYVNNTHGITITGSIEGSQIGVCAYMSEYSRTLITSTLGTYGTTENFTSDDSQYSVGQLSNGDVVLGIALGSVTVADIDPQTYNGSQITPKPTVKKSGSELTENTHFTYSYGENKNAGTGTVTIEGANLYFGTVTKNFTINKAALTVTAEAKSRNYGETNPELTYTHGTLQGSDNEAVFTGALACAATETSAPGTYDITLGTLSAGDNYEIAFAGAQLTVNTIDMASGVTVTPYNAAYDGSAHGISIELSDAAAGATITYCDTEDGTYQSENYTYTNVAAARTVWYKVTKANYTTITGSSTVTINPLEATLSWENTSFTYDGDTKTPTCTVSNLVEGDTCTVTVTGGQTNAGTYTATAAALDNANYKLPATVTKEFTISAKTDTDSNGNEYTDDGVDLTLNTLADSYYTDGHVSVPAQIDGKDVTAISDDLFNGHGDLNYIDLSDTKVTGFDRSSLTGVSDATLIYLPAAGNTKGDENVIVGDECADFVIYDDRDTYEIPTAFTADKTTLDRDFTANVVATVYLPFAIEVSSVNGTFHTFQGIEGSNAVLSEAITGSTVANTPYIFMPTSDGKISLNSSVSIDATVDASTNAELIGTYQSLNWTEDQDDIYGFAANEIGDISVGTFVRVGAGASIKPFRAYLKVTGAAARLAAIIDGGDGTTGISIMNGLDDNDSWYNLQGRKLSGKPTKQGLYINNGKKVIIK